MFGGVFLSVYDERLKFDANSSSDVNAVTEKIGRKDGGGCYFDLHTGPNRDGFKVDDETMATYLKRFGVPDDQILKLPLSLRYVPSTPNLNKNKVGKKKICTTCHMKWFTYQDCSVCGMVPYCSRECQRIG